MTITMVKKIYANGETCRKCQAAVDLLTERGFWDRITNVVIAKEDDPQSEGRKLADEHNVKIAPFFIVEKNGKTKVYKSVLRLIKEQFSKGLMPD